MYRPLGDHAGSDLLLPPLVKATGGFHPLPFLVLRYNWLPPPRSDENTIDWPSGEY